MEVDINNVCRVCLQVGKMMPVFSVGIHKKLMACASVQVWPEDGLPSQICIKCSAKLHICFQFKKLCERSDSHLRQYLKTQVLQRENAMKSKEASLSPYTSTEKIQSFKGNQRGHQDSDQISFDCNDIQIYEYPTTCCIATGDLEDNILANQHQNQPALEVQINHIENNEPTINDNANSTMQCKICGKNMPTLSKLNRHLQTHSKTPSLQCKICMKGFSHTGNFKIHMRMHNDERPFKCVLCASAFRQNQDLEKHIRTHTGERPHACHLCSKAFATRSNLVAHIRTHTGERPYVCCVCHKGFCQSNELTKHMRTHTGEKSHVCNICNKGFNGSGSLHVHMRLHTGEKPYTCKVCNKSFTTSHALKVHSKIHGSVEDCSTNDDLETSIQTTSNQQTYQCNICQKQFSRMVHLKKHHYNVHDGNKEIT